MESLPDNDNKNQDLTSRTMSAAAWNFGSIIIQAVLQLLVTSVLAHFIPPEEFGLFAIASIVIGAVSLFAQVGIGPTVVQRKELTSATISNAYTLSILLGFIGYIFIWLTAPLFETFFKQEGVTQLIRMVGLLLVLSGYSSVATAILQRELLFRKISLINIASYVIGYGVIGCGLAVLRGDVWAIVLSSISQNLIILLLLLFTSPRLPKFSFQRDEQKSLLTYSAGVSFAQIFSALPQYIDNAIIGRFLGKAALGLYQMSFQIMDLPRRFLGIVIDQVLFVVMSRIQDDKDKMRLAYLQTLRVANLLFISITVVMIISAPELVKVILGDKWTGAVLPLQIMLSQVPLRVTVRMADSISTATGKVYTLGWYKVLYTALIGVGVLLGLRWDLIGVALAVTIVVGVNWSLMIFFTLKIIKGSLREYLRTWPAGLFVGILITLFSLIARSTFFGVLDSGLIRLIVLVLVAAIVAVVSVILFPRFIGLETIRLGLDFAKRGLPNSKILLWLETKVLRLKGG